MIEVNWDLAPEGAVALKQDAGKWKNVTWIHADGRWWDDTDATWNPERAENKWIQTIAVRPVTQIKTVADAVGALKDRNPCINYGYVAVCKIAHSDWLEVGDFEFVGEGYDKEIFDIVCTRAVFEAYVKEQEGEKWTHRYMDENCLIACDEHDMDGYICILREGSGYDIVKHEKLKPIIKPTLTKAQAWDMLKQTPDNIRSLDDALIEITDKYDITD